MTPFKLGTLSGPTDMSAGCMQAKSHEYVTVDRGICEDSSLGRYVYACPSVVGSHNPPTPVASGARVVDSKRLSWKS